MTKEELIIEIQTAFKDVKLEDGIGLWEAQGLDGYADKQTMLELRKKDERYDWDNISYQDIADCESSLSFFDAKGMRFCLPKFLIFALLEEQVHKDQGLFLATDLLFHLGYESEWHDFPAVFSLLNNQQIECIIHYLKYKIAELIATHKEYGATLDSIDADYEYKEINKVLNKWKQKLDNLNSCC